MKKFLNDSGKRVLAEEQFDEAVTKWVVSGGIEARRFRKGKANAKPSEWAKMKLFAKKRYADNRELLSERKREERKRNPEKARELDRKNYYRKRDKKLATKKSHYENNREKLKKKQREYNARMSGTDIQKERDKKRHRKYYDANSEKVIGRTRQYDIENHEKQQAYRTRYARERRKADPAMRLAGNLRGRLSRALRMSGSRKHQSAMEFGLPTIQDLMSYLERLFETGMNWSNRGNEEGCWEVDHIMPLQGEGVDLNEPSHQYALCHYSNLQPLWFEDNREKRDQVTPEARRLFNKLKKEFEKEK